MQMEPDRVGSMLSPRYLPSTHAQARTETSHLFCQVDYHFVHV
jgi:hypothetical protein